MKTFRVFLGLGSNLGERGKNLASALAELKRLSGTTVVWASSVYESEPYGRKDQPHFLNAAVELETTLAPAELLARLKELERRLGRTDQERWAPRIIDLDILVYDGLVVEDENVTVPHPELTKRRFVLVPLREIAPDLVHPISGLTIAELAATCQDTGRIVKSTYHLIV